MTTPLGPVVFNADEGSDTQASGLGPDPAVYGSGASITSGSASVTGIDTTGVLAGHLMWVQASSGRQFSVIQSVVSSTEVLCDTTFAVTETGRTWAIGGKRATLEDASSRNMLNEDLDTPLVFKVKLETDQDINSPLYTSGSISIEYPLIIYSDNLSTINQTANNQYGVIVNQSRGALFYNLKFITTGGSTNVAASAISAGSHVIADNCVFGEDGGSNNFTSAMRGNAYGHNLYARNCTFYGNGVTYGQAFGGGHYNGDALEIHNCYMKGFDRAIYAYPGRTRVSDCIIDGCNNGIVSGGTARIADIRNTVFHNLTADAIYFNDMHVHTFQSYYLPFLSTNIFSNVGGAILRVGTNRNTADYEPPNVEPIHVYNCPTITSGDMFNIPTVSLSSNPFVDPANGDFNLDRNKASGLYLLNQTTKIGRTVE